MADIVIDVTQVRVLQLAGEYSELTLLANVALLAGEVVRPDATTGKWVKTAGGSAANSGTLRYMVHRSVAAGQAVTGYKLCWMAVGLSALDGIAFGAPLYISNNAGKLTATIGESTSAVIFGYIIPPAVTAKLPTTPDRVINVL